ncbi:hypothetical protein HAX54_000497 [Datura stramonium]|uniref:Uncharacterized protein n=1 Tax=Datura stramonium TaxID=4076 RepID=A0ABS8WPZ5_DATST|nr:hypothetical protein [Datura stramonium]
MWSEQVEEDTKEGEIVIKEEDDQAPLHSDESVQETLKDSEEEIQRDATDIEDGKTSDATILVGGKNDGIDNQCTQENMQAMEKGVANMFHLRNSSMAKKHGLRSMVKMKTFIILNINDETKRPPPTFGSFLPPHFQSILEENEALSNSDSTYLVHLAPYGDTTTSLEKIARILHFLDIDNYVHASPAARPQFRDNRKIQKDMQLDYISPSFKDGKICVIIEAADIEE